jgi:hypothetical protein
VLALFQDPDIPAQAGSDFGNTTEVHPVGVAALALLTALALLVPRRWSTLPVILLLCFIPAGQRIVIATVDFTFIRLLMMVIWGRLVLRSEIKAFAWNHLDRAMVVWAVTLFTFGTLQAMTLTALVNRVGVAIDAMMVYFFFRLVIRDADDLIHIAMQFMVSGFAVAVFFFIENRTQHNMFGVLGGVPLITDVRDGRLRCQGAFAHAILAGCFWACLVPFYFARGWLGRGWLFPLFGTMATLAIVLLCASSTPIMAVLFGVLGGASFFVRGALRWLRWLIFGWLCILHLVLMKQPVWHLLARVDVVGGSTGWHRFHLVDKFIANFPEWWLVGTPATGHWGPGLHDVTNQFVSEGVSGGLAQLVMFCLCVWFAFSGISRSMRTAAVSPANRLIAWALGTAMFMHCMNFIAVTYFEQIVVLWYMTLAACASLTLVPGVPIEQQLRRQSALATA